MWKPSRPDPAGVATVLIVFGRGLIRRGDEMALTAASRSRVDAAADHVRANQAVFAALRAAGRPGRIVFSGGWAGAASGEAAPPLAGREGALMLAYGRGLPVAGRRLADYAELHAEVASRSTLENLLNVRADGLLDGYRWGPEHPLGLVAHRAHLRRIRHLAGTALSMPRRHLQPIEATGPDGSSGNIPEPALYLATRLLTLAAASPQTVLRRERELSTLLDRVRRR